MLRRRPAIVLLAHLALFLMATVAHAQSAPTLVSAASRKSHGAASHDVALPLAGASGIECRTVAGGVSLVLTFDKPVNGGAAGVTAGVATVNGNPVFAGTTMTVNLTGVANAQQVTVGVTNVTSTDGGSLAAASASVRPFQGDVDGNGIVSASDVNRVKVQAGAAITKFNFRNDVGADGSIGASDVNLVKVGAGASVTGGPTGDTPPTIATIADQVTSRGVASPSVGFAVGDLETLPANLALTGTSDNPTLVPTTAFTFAGAGESRTVSITPAANQTGTANVTVSVTDGQNIASTTFKLTVTPPPTLFIANMTPQGVAASGGSGSGTLLLSGDETSAVVRFSYSNMTTPEVSKHVHGPAGPTQSGGIIFDLDDVVPQNDGSFKWTFVPVGTNSVADLVSAIKTGNTYINIHSQTYPNGEIRGQFVQAAGSQTFTPPPAPPALPGGPPTANDASRFLQQATFGATMADIQNVQAIGFDQWLSDQFAMPASRMYDVLYTRCTTPQQANGAGDPLDSNLITNTWWKHSVSAPDQLRQRTAFAYSQIFVISRADEAVNGQLPGVASYYDMLADDAFVNFRQLIKDVTLHPIMGRYPNMRGSVRASSGNGNKPPNENYGREILQLFSIGVNTLQPDGTLKLDLNGLPIPTYDQTTIRQFAEVFTGWNSDPSAVVVPTLIYDAALVPPGTRVSNFNSTYNKPMIVNAGNHSRLVKNLLAYNLPNGQPAPRTIAANASQTVATANAELDFALDNIFNHPNLGPFICRQLIQRLVGSNPSPGYLYRVASIFNDDGSAQHVRGNMQAVIKAILTDYEARSTAVLNNQGYGHLREPLVRTTNVMRAFHGFSPSGYYKLGNTDANLAQTPLRAPTVFNFFEPGYVYSGQIAEAGLVAPEFQITSETTVVNATNFLYSGINTSTGFSGGDIRLDLATEQAILLAAGSPDPIGSLMNHVDLLLMSGQMPSQMRSRIITYLNTITTTDLNARALNRAKAAIYLTVASPQHAAQK